MLQRLFDLVRYNRDWPKYLAYRYISNGKPVSFRLRNGQVITMPSESRFCLNEMYLDRVYDLAEFDWSSARHVLDLGANIGLFALYVASRNPGATIHCFEPEAENFARLSDNIRRNGVNAKLYRMAVSDRCGSASLELRSSFSHRLRTDADGESVQCVDLARVFQLCGVQHFDFSKIDIEGEEVEILNSNAGAQLQRLGAISMEWHQSKEQMEQTAEKLREMGCAARCEYIQNLPYIKGIFNMASGGRSSVPAP